MRVSVVRGAIVGTIAIVLVGQIARPQAGQDRVRPTDPVDPTSCMECHAEVKQRDFVHGPVAVEACAACHTVDSVEGHTYKLAREGAALCTFCHDVPLDGAMSVHAPVVDGACIACHDPHGSHDRTLVRAPSADQLCASCHGDVTAGAEHVHGPVAVGACSACHLSHASPHASLLRRPGSEMCTSCHVETTRQLENFRVIHEPVKSDCAACHDPHASKHAMMLRAEPQQLCLDCHDTIRHTVETAATQHAAVTTDRQCMNCHVAHASDHPRILRDDMMTLCFECHDREIVLEDGQKLADMKAIVHSGASLHGPVAQSNCAACHLIHGGDNFRMLVREYPPEFYAPFAEERYALCFGCHEKDLVHDARTTSLTDFRNGDVNLHYVHVNRETKGRSCRACHETHAATQEKHIRASVPFGPGGWELPIGFEKTDTGGSCAPGCHKPYGYDRLNPIPFPAAETKPIWPGEGGAPKAPGAGAGGGGAGGGGG